VAVEPSGTNTTSTQFVESNVEFGNVLVEA
jgi:hypothetical protein